MSRVWPRTSSAESPAGLTPAFAEPAEQAVEGWLLDDDDTTMRIPNFTREAGTEALPPGARADRTGVFTSGPVAETARGPIALSYRTLNGARVCVGFAALPKAHRLH